MKNKDKIRRCKQFVNAFLAEFIHLLSVWSGLSSISSLKPAVLLIWNVSEKILSMELKLKLLPAIVTSNVFWASTSMSSISINKHLFRTFIYLRNTIISKLPREEKVHSLRTQCQKITFIKWTIIFQFLLFSCGLPLQQTQWLCEKRRANGFYVEL